MESAHEATRQELLKLLDATRQETRALLRGLDPDRVIHTDERAWRVRDILGHLGVWNLETVRSLQAYVEGGEYCCIPSEARYYDYNGPAVDERKAWSLAQVWAEYEDAHDRLRQIVATLPGEKLVGELLYPWNLRGSVDNLVRIMMKHETVDHCALVIEATT